MSITKLGLSIMASLVLLPAMALAQTQAGGGGAGGAGGGGRGGFGPGGGGFDPAQIQQFLLDNIKEQLAASDDEWKVLQPKVQAVLTAQQEVTSGRGRGGFGGRGGPGGGGPGGGGPGGGRGGGPGADTATARAMAELRTVLADTNATAAQITAKVAAVRDARTKAAANLATVQKGLKELLTARQEAVMISMGYLE